MSFILIELSQIQFGKLMQIEGWPQLPAQRAGFGLS
jgi:hypothetical protein